jgi:hypothetical protein
MPGAPSAAPAQVHAIRNSTILSSTITALAELSWRLPGSGSFPYQSTLATKNTHWVHPGLDFQSLQHKRRE